MSNNRIILRRTKSQPYFQAQNINNLFQQIPNKKYQISPPYMNMESPLPELKENQIYQNQPQSHLPIEHLVSTSTQIPAQFLNQRNQNYIRHPFKTYPANRLNQNINLNYNQNQMQSTMNNNNNFNGNSFNNINNFNNPMRINSNNVFNQKVIKN